MLCAHRTSSDSVPGWWSSSIRSSCAGRSTFRATASTTAAAPTSGPSRKCLASLVRAPARRLSAARLTARESWYNRARPSAVSAALTTTGNGSNTSGPSRRPRHRTASNATTISHRPRKPTHGGANSLRVAGLPAVGTSPSPGRYQTRSGAGPRVRKAKAALPSSCSRPLLITAVLPRTTNRPSALAAYIPPSPVPGL